jgi:DNA polymerase III delta prime subunit
MHAYLITGSKEVQKEEAEKLAQKLGTTIFEFPLQKIEDVRELQSFTNLAVSHPTAILLYSIESAGAEALNALLKNLEEPQANLYYILTAQSAKAVLPTIVSRCQLVRTNPHQASPNEEIDKFLNMPKAKKLVYLERVKKREEAQDFVEQLLAASHGHLHERDADYQKIAQEVKAERATLSALRANGNVTVQLTNLAILLAN